MTAIDRDDEATWVQLRDRLREIRAWAEEWADEGEPSVSGALTILNRPRETSGSNTTTPGKLPESSRV